MKKLLCLLLAAVMLLCLAACNKPENDKPENDKPEEPTQEKKTVTIYMLESVTATSGAETATLKVILEEGWQNKDSITAKFQMDTPEGSVAYSMHYEEKRTVMDYGEGAQKITILYDDHGRAISQTVTFPEGASVTKNETLTTYDDKGRITKQETNMYYADQKEPVTQQSVAYTYVDTEDGSKGTAIDGGIVQELYYDANGRAVKNVTMVDGKEVTRTQYTYDDNGNQVKQETYVSGTLTATTVNTYKTYEIDGEKAEKMPYLRQAK